MPIAPRTTQRRAAGPDSPTPIRVRLALRLSGRRAGQARRQDAWDRPLRRICAARPLPSFAGGKLLAALACGATVWRVGLTSHGLLR